MRSSVRLLVYAQICLWLFLFVCFLLIPHYLLQRDEGGISNYGVYRATIVPYTLAFGACGLLTLQAAHVLPERTVRRKPVWRILVIFGWLCFFVLESTYLYQVGGALDGIHIVAGLVLSIFQVWAALWFGRAFPRDVLQDCLLALQLVGFVLGVLTFVGILQVLFIAEVTASVAFGSLLVRTVRQAIVA